MIGSVEHHIEEAGTGGTAAYRVSPKVAEDGAPQGDLLEVSMGPHHPSTHGVFRMNVVVDGETNADAAWFYPEPKAAASQIKDRLAFWKGVRVVA